jgi:pimeloyl-ACP methyl ester carboxylesterase
VTRPSLLLVHGAFHGAWCWDLLKPELERLGIEHDTVDFPLTSPEDDVAAVRSALDGHEDVAVLAHSFGGAVVSAAATEGGRPYGGATSLIFLTALMATPEQSVDFSGAPGMARIQLGEVTASIDPTDARSAFYHRCSVRDAAWATAHLRSMPTSVLTSPPPASPAWQVMPSTYIICTDDRVLSLSAQEQMAANADRTRRIDSDHSPFLSCPRTLAAMLREVVAEA